MKFSLLLCIFLCALSIIGQKNLTQKEIQSHVVEQRQKNPSAFVDFVKFDGKINLSPEMHSDFARVFFGLTSDHSLLLNDKNSDQLGWTHFNYAVLYKGIQVQHSVLKFHMKGEVLLSINGDLKRVEGSVTPSFSKEQAISAGLQSVPADAYKWENTWEELLLQRETENPNATYFPAPELVWFTPSGNAGYQLCYRMDVYASEPLSRQWVYVDAHTNAVVGSENRIHTADSNGVAVTAYSGNKAIVADYFANQFRLRESGRGNGIQTFDLNNTSNYGSAVDFTDADNFWNNTTNQDQYAGDAHWGSEMTYDYYWQIHNRNSIDGNGFMLKNYVHYNTNYNNAFWDGQRMTYGDGDGSVFSPLTSIDIAGHEVTHGLTSNTANLVYSNESGALNESFSDVFGVSIESFANNNALNWVIGEDATPNGNGIRNMSNPNAFSDPDTYLGTNYYTGSQDNGGVHTNSGVQNYWYYLLTVGGTGTNDIGNAYNVPALGMLKASRIAFRNLTVYLTPNSDHQDARFYAIQAAIDLYGACSPEVMSTTNAWYAVGVGQVFSYTVNAQFSTAFQNYCQAPALVNFTNESFNAGTFTWNFGDGASSNALNPSHVYQNPGLYTVSLIVSGGACGTDTLTMLNYINVDPNLPCAITMNPAGQNQTQNSCSGTLFDPGGLASNYQDLVTSEIVIAPLNASYVTLNFSLFDFELDYDYLYVYDGPTSSSPLIGQYTGNALPNGGTIQSTYGTVTIKFFSDTYVNNAGFVMTWTCQIPSTPPITDFYATSVTSCDGNIQFVDETTEGPTNWAWNFGDGTTSNLQNPLHVYTQDGLFTVSLVTGNAFGTDTMTQLQYIQIDRPDAPLASDVVICSPDSVTVSATANGSIKIYDEEFDGNLLVNGGTYSMFLPQTDTLWLENVESQPTQYVGPLNNSFGTGGQHNNASTQYMIFTVNEPLTIVSAWVNAGAVGDRTITLWDASGNQLDSRFLNIPAGGSRIALNFHLEPGVNYRMGGSQMNLYRNNAGAVFPYQIPGLISITASSAGGAFYYYFYDWEIVKDPCISPRVPVHLIMDQVQAVANVSAIGMTATVGLNGSINANQYTWDFGDGFVSNVSAPSHTYAVPGTYPVSLIAANANCSDTLILSATVDNAGLSDFNAGGLNVYPNPTQEILVVKDENASYFAYEITDLTGRVVMQNSLDFQHKLTELNVSALRTGVYKIRCFSKNDEVIRSFVKID